VNALGQYLKVIVEPTVEEFKRNPTSLRHAFLACVATYHAIDRVTHPKPPGNLRKTWGDESMEFRMVDIVAHDFKHVKSNDHRMTTRIPVSRALYGKMAFNTHTFNDTGQRETLRNLTFLVDAAVKFVHQKADTMVKRGAPSGALSRRQHGSL
jgi:hypothetical protein